MGSKMRYGSNGAERTGGWQVDEIWTNQDETQSFPAQNVPANLSGYRLVGIVCNFGSASGNQYAVNMQIFTVDDGQKYLMISADNNRGGERGFVYDAAANEIQFAGARYNGSASDAYLIPVRIFGIK